MEIEISYVSFEEEEFLFAFLSDITERKRTEDALRDSEASLLRAQEVAHIGSWCLDLAQNELLWSDETFRIFGLPPGQALSYEAFLERIPPEERDNVDKAWTAAFQGALYDIEHRITVDGGVKWVHEKAEIECDDKGNAIRGIGTVQDITERKRAEEELRESEERFRLLSEQSVMGLMILQDDEYKYVNQAAADILRVFN